MEMFAEGASGRSSVTHLLRRLRGGDRGAFDRLFSLIYPHLRTLAQGQRRRWQGEPSLNTTALVHEAYVRLAGIEGVPWQDRAHFMAVAATAMRQILIDRARSRSAVKRGGDRRAIPLDQVRSLLAAEPGLTDTRAEALLALDRSLGRLRQEDPRQHRIVECRFFGGMTIADTAEALGVSPATVKRSWLAAQAWLYRDLVRSTGGTLSGEGVPS